MLTSTQYQRCAESFALLADEVKERPDETALHEIIKETFRENRSVYGARKLKKALEKKHTQLSRRKIARIMKALGLESAYSRKKFKVVSSKVNDAPIPNLLNRQFNDHPAYAAVVSDLT